MKSHMHVSPELKKRVEAELVKAKQETRIDVGPVEVRYDIDSAHLGGQARYRGNIIRLNPVFLNAYTEEYLKTTLRHEYAHLAAFHVCGRAGVGHGNPWKQIFARTGSPVSRCHSYSVPEEIKAQVGKKTARYEAHCDKCGHKFELTSKRVSKMKTGTIYRHASCGGKAVLTNEAVLQLSGTVRTGVTPTVPKTGAKIDRCRDIYIRNRSVSRAAMIALFVERAGCTDAGANTYYSKLKKELG